MSAPLKTLARYAAHGVAVLLILFFLLLALLSTLLPPIAKNLASRHDIALTIENVDIGWLRGRVEVFGVAIAAHSSDTPVKLEQLQLDINLRQLLRAQHVYIDDFTAKGLTVPATLVLNDENQAEQMIVAGIDPQQLINPDKNPEANQPQPDDKSAALSFVGWRQISLHKLAVDTQLEKAGQVYPLAASLNFADIGRLNTQDSQARTPISSQLSLGEASISVSGDVAPLAPGREGHVALSLDSVMLSQWKKLADFLQVPTADIKAAAGELSLSTTIEWWLAGDRNFLTANALELNGRALEIAMAQSEKTAPSDQPGKSVSADGLTASAELNVRAERIAVNTRPLSCAVEQVDVSLTDFLARDQQLDPPLDLSIAHANLQLDQIDSGDTSKPSELLLTASVGKYGKLNGQASGTFLHKQANGKVELSGEQINLTQFSGLAKNAIGKHIDKGALDLRYVASIAAGELDSEARIEAHQLGLSGNFGSKTNFVEELGMPLNAALNLLRDKDDTVRLTVPVKGNLADPQVKIGRVVNKALLNGVKTAALTQFGPLLALSAIDKARNLATGLQLKSVEFDHGEETLVALDKSAIEQLQSTVKLLDSRPKITLNVCGFASHTEIAGRAKPAEATVVDIETLATDSKNRLYTLATHRAEAIKGYLIERGIEGRRLILCSPKLDGSAEGKPRVEFSL